MPDHKQGIFKRYLLGAVLIVLASASATGVAAFQELDSVVDAFEHNRTLDLEDDLQQAAAGKPQTITHGH